MGETSRLFSGETYELELINETTYTRNSADNLRSYDRVHNFDKSGYSPNSRLGLILHEERRCTPI